MEFLKANQEFIDIGYLNMSYKPIDYTLKTPTLGQAIRGGIKEAISLRAAEQKMGIDEQAQGLAQARLGLDEQRLGFDERQFGLQERQFSSQEANRNMQIQAIRRKEEEARNFQSRLKELLSVPQEERDQKWAEELSILLGKPEEILKNQWAKQGPKKKETDLIEMGIISDLGRKDDKESIRTLLERRVEAAKNTKNQDLIQDAKNDLEVFDFAPDSFIASQQMAYQNLFNKGKGGEKETIAKEAARKGASKSAESFSSTHLKPLIDAGVEARSLLGALQEIDAASEDLNDMGWIKRVVSSFGGTLSDAGSTFESRVNYLAPRLRVAGSGTTSDKDFDALLAALPRARQSKEAREEIIRALTQAADRAVKRSESAARLDAQYAEGKISPTQIIEKLTDFDNKGWLSEDFKSKYNVGRKEKSEDKRNISSIYEKYG